MATTISVKVNKGQTYGQALQKAGVNNPTRTDYTFIGWNTKADGTGETRNSGQAVVKSEIVYAQWQIKTYTVTFDLSGGSRTGGGQLIQTISLGGNAIPPTVVRSGFSFDGWSGDYTNITSNRTITATWTQMTDKTNNFIGADCDTTYAWATATYNVTSMLEVFIKSATNIGLSTINVGSKKGSNVNVGTSYLWWAENVSPDEDDIYYYIY